MPANRIAPALVFALLSASAWAQETAPEPATTRSAPYPIGDDALDAHFATLLSQHLRHCWRMPSDLPNPQRLRVTVTFELNEDGALRGEPRVVSPTRYRSDTPMRTAVERALDAVRTCSPYPFAADPIASQHYERWREVQVAFHPPP